jgi:hypothetical protein
MTRLTKILTTLCCIFASVWFFPVSDYNCHCYAWHDPGCRCRGGPGHGTPVDTPKIGDKVTYSFGSNGWVNHSAVYIGNGWCKGKLGTMPVIYHPLKFAFPYGTHYQIWRTKTIGVN